MPKTDWNLQHSYTQLPEIFYLSQYLTPAPVPKTVIFNHALARDLGLDTQAPCAEIFTGSRLPHGAKPICQAYAGYQFGHFAMLGDGRAVLLGEQITPDGRRFDIQLKGSGPTPFSRGGDGYAALMPMLREYIISEAMYYLGIPTTRSLAVALTGRDVIREKALKGAVLTRVASSHIRVGTFNFIAAFGTRAETRALADYCIWRHFPWLAEEGERNRYVSLFREIASRQATLIASWQLIGFVHGVMNTDNMAISGETIDYGPCAFMDVYDPDTVFSSIDTMGRYAYKNQPEMGAWNLARLAEALLHLFDEDENKARELAQNIIEDYWAQYKKSWLAGMRAKLGMMDEKPEDIALIAEILALMAKYKLDYTNTFRGLSRYDAAMRDFERHPELAAWHKKWQARLGSQSHERTADIMKAHNPAVIPRNHRVEEALSAADSGDYTVMRRLLAALSKPYEDLEEYAQPGPTSCSYRTFCGT